MDIQKIIRFLIKHWKAILVLSLLLIIIPLPTIQFLYWLGDKLGKYAFTTIYTSSEILSYFSGTWGALLGAISTFVALYLTFSYEKFERNADRTLSVLPYLDYKIVDYLLVEVKEESYLWHNLMPELEIIDQLRNGEKDFVYPYDIIFCLEIKNIGQGNALNVYIIDEEFDGAYTGNIGEVGNIIVNHQKYIKFTLLYNAKGKIIRNDRYSGWVDIVIKLAYENVLQEYYEQDIKIRCSWSCTHQGDTILNTNYNAWVEEVSEPKPDKKKNSRIEYTKKMSSKL